MNNKLYTFNKKVYQKILNLKHKNTSLTIKYYTNRPFFEFFLFRIISVPFCINIQI